MPNATLPRALSILMALSAAGSLSAQLTSGGSHVISATEASGVNEAGDNFGGALAAGDFDCDGLQDLAIGVPNEDIGDVVDAGAVFIVYGTTSGLNAEGARAPLVLHQNISGVNDVSEAFDHFGASLAVGRINGDACDDLAVGVPGENAEIVTPAVLDVGMVHVWTGSLVGPVPAADSVWHDFRLEGSWVPNANFGQALAFGDLNHDGGDDLIVGSPGFGNNYGAIDIVYTNNGSLSTTGTWGTAAGGPGGQYGSAIATGLFNDDDIVDVAVAAPYRSNGGTVLVLLGDNSTGPKTTWLDSVFGGGSSDHDLGFALAAADTRCRDRDELVMADPTWDTEGGTVDAGAVVIYDYTVGFETYRQGEDGIAETAEPSDLVASAFGVGDFNGDGCEDVAFGVALENLFDGGLLHAPDAGVVHALYGDTDGLQIAGNQLWSLESPGTPLSPLAGDHLGEALAAGDFNGDGADDLAIGAPTAEWSSQAGAGLVLILYGDAQAIFTDGFESGDVTQWN